MTPIYRPLPAALWMLGSVFTFIAIGIAGRALKGHVEVPEIMLYRAITGLVVVVGILVIQGKLREIETANFKWHMLRNSVHFLGQGLWLWALMLIPMAQLFAIEFTSPVWVVLLAPLLLGESLTKVKALAAVLGFTGAVIVARPDFSNLDPGVVAAAGSAICFACNVIMTKRLTGQEGILSILFWQTFIQMFLGLGVAAWDGVVTLPPLAMLPWLIVVGMGGLFAHFCLARALSLAPASFVIPIDFVRLPLAAATGYALYAEAIDLAVFLGAALIFLGNWVNIRYGAR